VNILISLSANAITNALKIKISNGTYSDETVVRFLPNATNNFDPNYDAWKQFSSNSAVPAVFTNIDPQSHLSINALPTFSSETKVDLCFYVGTSGTYTIQSIELGAFLSGVSIMLEDKMTGMIYKFRGGNSFAINLFANTIASASRFTLHFSPPTNVAFTNVTCNSLTDGALTVTKSGNTNWNYQLMNNSGNIIQSGNAINENATITDLNVGNYFIATNSAYTTPDTTSFTIIQPASIVADFEVDTVGIRILPNMPIQFENYSSGASLFTWDFGDGSPQSTQFAPTHQYAAAGTYTVILTAASLSCDVAYSNTIYVHPNLTTNVGLVSNEQNTVSVTQQNEMLVINSQAPTPTQMIIAIYNTLGQNVYSFSRDNTSNVSESVSLPAAGTYFVSVYANNIRTNKKVTYTK
jgi:PKD repeat protein